MQTAIELIGLPSDSNSSFERGAAMAPPLIRAALWSDRGNLACENGMEVGRDFELRDRGDLQLLEQPEDDGLIAAAVSDVVASGAVPLVLGGDHAMTHPVVRALHAVHGPLTILHVDAHPDLYADFESNPRSHASPFARIMEAGLARRLAQVGIRTMNAHCREQAARYGVEVLPMADFAASKVPVLEGPLYISIDLDGIDPGEAPGVSHPEPGGLTVREVLAVLRRQTARVIGADVVEYNPRFDSNERTAIVAAKLVRELAALIAQNSARG
ncbi:agmatinase family protein [Novosphingobium sp. B 225]|uniref:agmatinase family protein n=1 Tax=Novosphingobium sp. B 225 TaxID=1961849 RepID=UPI000B4AD34A|nr:agmatinase family protein [Novosphingobium sp. B 225]